MLWKQKPSWFGRQLALNIEALQGGDQSRIPWIFCALAEKHDSLKDTAAKALQKTLDGLSFHEVIRIDTQMRETTSMEWSINWHELDLDDLLTPQMSPAQRRAVLIFASFNPNGFIRKKAIRLMREYDGTLPYIILRQNDWVRQVRQTAAKAFAYRLERLSDGEIIDALPFAEKLKWSSRDSHGAYTEQFFAMLTSPAHRPDLMKGLNSKNIRTRRICTNALFGATPPKIEMAFERLNCEPEPFLRTMIFRKLRALGQSMDDAVSIFLRDKYPPNRMLAFQYLLDTSAESVREIALQFLLDKNAMMREAAQRAVLKQTPDFDFRAFYLNHLDNDTGRYTAAALSGIGEKGHSEDAAQIAGYLEDTRIFVVKATMVSLIRLDCKKYSAMITEMLDDARAGIVKTAWILIMKMERHDYERVKELFYATVYEHTRLKCMDILFAASKWQRVIYMLEVVSIDDEQAKKKALIAIKRWLFEFNRSFALPNAKQAGRIKNLIHSLKGELPPGVEKELLFMLS